MKSARELFKELGYTYQESYFEEKLDEINYSKSGDYAPQIIFNLNHKCVMVYRKKNKTSWFDVKILQAINQQVNELGWNDTILNLDVKLDGKKVMEPHRRRELLKIRQSFLERYKLAKQFKDKFYTEYFAKQIRYIDEELKGIDR